MELLFKRGFIISENSQDKYINSLNNWISKKWLREKFGSFYFYNDHDVEKTTYKHGKNYITLLGTLIDPINKIGDSNVIIKKLLEKYLENKNLFFDYLDFLTGRFIIFLETEHDMLSLHDATGINAVFYNDLQDEVIISSHSQIIAEIKNYKIEGKRYDIINSADFKSKTCYMPGLYTPYKEVTILSPNTLLDLKGKKIRRFFPREKLKKRKVKEELIFEISEILKNTFQLLTKKYQLAVSLTGGMDSRITLASSKDWKDKIIYFTYVFDNDKEDKDDINLAEKISKIALIKHDKYFIDGEKYNKNLEIFNRNSAYLRPERQGKLANAILEKYPKERMHIKSSVNEIGEGFYFRHYFPIVPLRFLLHFILSYFYRTNKYSSFTHKAFKDFIKITHFNEIFKYNYNYYDMFYWEHRIGSWQSLQNQDLNIVHDTFVIYNNRHLLKKLLSVSIKERLEMTLQFAIIKYLWPELLDITIKAWIPFTLRQKVTKLAWLFLSPFLH